MNLFGMTILSSEYLPKKRVFEQSKYPASKCKRIRKKWRKRYGRWVEHDQIFMVADPAFPERSPIAFMPKSVIDNLKSKGQL